MATAAREFGEVAATDPRSARALAEMYGKGYIGERGSYVRKQVELLELATRNGDAQAQADLGRALIGLYLRPQGEQADFAKDVPAGLEHLRKACVGEIARACLLLAQVFSADKTGTDAAHVADLPQPDESEAAKAGKQWIGSALKTKGFELQMHAFQLWYSGGQPWANLDIEARAMYFALWRLLSSTEDKAKPANLKGLSDEQYTRAQLNARALAAKLGVIPSRVPAPAKTAGAIASAFSFTDEPDEAILRATALYLGWEARGARFDRTAEDFYPVVRQYARTRSRILKETGLGTRERLATELPKSLNDVQLYQGLEFLSSPTGRKYLSLVNRLQLLRTEAATLGVRLERDPALTKLGTSYLERMKAYASSVGASFETNPSDFAAARRDRFFVDLTLKQHVAVWARSLEQVLRTQALLQALGAPYEEAKRLLSDSEMTQVELFHRTASWKAAQQVMQDLQSTRDDSERLKQAHAEFLASLRKLVSP